MDIALPLPEGITALDAIEPVPGQQRSDPGADGGEELC